MKLAKLAMLTAAPALLAATPFAASAQSAGDTIFSQEETPTEVGTVVSNDGTTVLVDTGTHQAPLPAGYFAEREGNWTINATKGQIDAMMDAQVQAAEAKLTEALVAGTAVTSADNAPVGTILAIGPDVDQYLISTGTGVITLKREHFSAQEDGTLMALFTGEQLAGFTIAVPEGAVVETPAGQMTRTADGWEKMDTDVAASDESAADAS